MDTIKERTKLTKVVMAAIKKGLTLKDLERLLSARVKLKVFAINCTHTIQSKKLGQGKGGNE